MDDRLHISEGTYFTVSLNTLFFMREQFYKKTSLKFGGTLRTHQEQGCV